MNNTIVENPTPALETAIEVYDRQLNSGLLQKTGKPLGLTAWAATKELDLDDKETRKLALKDWRKYVGECKSQLKSVGALLVATMEERGLGMNQIKPVAGGYNLCLRPLTKVETKSGSAELAAEKAKVAKLEKDMEEMRAMMLVLTAGRA